MYSGAAALAPSLSGLVACVKSPEGSAVDTLRRAGPGTGGYGELVLAGPELSLPAGFRYTVLGAAGTPMSNGHPTPHAHDGMAAFALANGNVRLTRNHENRDLPPGARVKGDVSLAYDRTAGGCVVSLEVSTPRDGPPRVVRSFVSLSGTIVNCAGGPTPWGSWLTCEESVGGRAQGWEKEHGYVFEVPAAAETQVQAQPITGMGRFAHEAVAVDPATGFVYETEDMLSAGFYRFIPSRRGVLLAGGTLQMLAVDGAPRYDTGRGQTVGRKLRARWVTIPNPDPDIALYGASAVYDQGFSRGGARFSRLEGCWYGDRSIYFDATNGGDAAAGQVWRYRPVSRDRGELTLIFESPGRDVLDAPDNITISPRGGVVICEDGVSQDYVRGLTRDGRIFDIARNERDPSEMAGACFSPDGRTFFVNQQGSTVDAGTLTGMTFAIQGPWERGAL